MIESNCGESGVIGNKFQTLKSPIKFLQSGFAV